MAGALASGYFPANYFTHRYWQLGNQYWTEYGAVTGGDSARYYYMQRKPPKQDRKQLFLQVKNLLQSLKGE